MSSLLSLLLMVSFNDPCPSYFETRAGIKIQTGSFSDNECFISVSETKWRGMLYRNFLFTNKAEILVFNSLGDGPSSLDTGARAFYLRPFRAELGWRFTESNDLEIRLPSGEIARFEADSAKWVELTNGEVQVDSEISRTNNGGVELRYNNGYLIDTGFRFGGHPTSRMEKTSLVTDADNVRCTVENKELFYRVGDEHEWNYPDNNEFSQWFENRCR